LQIQTKKAISNQNTKIIQEWFKCKENFEYFCRNYIKIDLPGATTLLQPYKEQLRVINFIQNQKHVVILKSRQIGISTIVQAYLVYLAVFFKNVSIGVISKDAGEATQFAKVCTSMLEYLPKWMKPKFKKSTEQSFILSNGSKLQVAAILPSNPQKTFRGRNLTVLVLDEAAHCQYIDQAWIGMSPALVTNQKHARQNNIPYATIILSTPNKTTGIGKWFFEKYKAALNGEGAFQATSVHWKDIQELGETWYQEQCNLLDHNRHAIDQELNLKFIPGEGAFFPEWIASKLQEQEVEPKMKINLLPGTQHEGWIFQEPNTSKFYLIGIDTASEYGSSKSAIEIFEYDTLEQVFEFQGKLPILDFKQVIIKIATLYPGILIVENNSYANQMVNELALIDGISVFSEAKPGGKISYGISTNAKTRPLMIDSLYSYVTQYPETIKSSRLKLELVGLVEKNGKIQADKGETDDLVLASSFCYYVRKYSPPLSAILRDRKSEEEPSSDLDLFRSITGWNSESGAQPSISNIYRNASENASLSSLNREIISRVKQDIEQGEIEDIFIRTIPSITP
jgi:hypothetical protein